jgi:hypothetical protein
MSDLLIIECLCRAGFDRQVAESMVRSATAETRLELEIAAALAQVPYRRAGIDRQTLLWLGRLVRVALEGRP